MKIEQYLKDFKYPDKIILESNVYADLPEHFLTFKATWEKIKDKLQDYMSNLPPDERQEFFDAINGLCEFESIEEFFVKTCWGWKPTGRKVKFYETDRLGQHCFGAMYTSAKHIWPMHNDIPFLPLVQIDIDKAGTLIDANVGDGFVQLYEAPIIDNIHPQELYLLRHIPRNEISAELLTELPTFSEDSKSRVIDYLCSNVDELFGDSSESIFIDDFNFQFLSFNENPFNGCDDELFSVLEEDYPELHEELIDDIEEFNLAFGAFCDSEDISYDGDANLFGFHSPIQEWPRTLHSPILNLGPFKNFYSNWDRNCIYFDGSGAIFVKFEGNGTPEYYFYGSR